MHVDPTITVPVQRHSYAVIDGPEHARELSSAFVTAGLALSERITLIGLTERQAGSLLTRLHEDGADPHGAVRDGELIIADQSVLTVTVYEDEIATLAADDADLPIGRLTSSAARFEVSPRCLAPR